MKYTPLQALANPYLKAFARNTCTRFYGNYFGTTHPSQVSERSGRLPERQEGRQIGSQAGTLAGRQADWLVGRLGGRLAGKGPLLYMLPDLIRCLLMGTSCTVHATSGCL